LSLIAAFSLRDGLNRLKEGSPTPETLQAGDMSAKPVENTDDGKSSLPWRVVD
jgi:hypothetical protein